MKAKAFIYFFPLFSLSLSLTPALTPTHTKTNNMSLTLCLGAIPLVRISTISSNHWIVSVIRNKCGKNEN